MEDKKIRYNVTRRAQRWQSTQGCEIIFVPKDMDTETAISVTYADVDNPFGISALRRFDDVERPGFDKITFTGDID